MMRGLRTENNVLNDRSRDYRYAAAWRNESNASQYPSAKSHARNSKNGRGATDSGLQMVDFDPVRVDVKAKGKRSS